MSYQNSSSRRYQQNRSSGSNGRPRHIEVSAEWIAPLEHMRRESLVGGVVGSTSVDDMIFEATRGATSAGVTALRSASGNMPLYFRGSGDEWHRVEALLPIMQSVAAEVSSHGGVVRMGIEHIGRHRFDLVVGPHKGGVVMVHFSHLLREGVRGLMHERLASISTAASLGHHFVTCCLLMIDVEEPQQDVLSWINLTCLEHRVTLQLCWSWSDAKAAIEGIDEGGGDHLAGSAQQYQRGRGNGSTASTVQTMIAALSQTPALMSRQDVIRAANKVGTVAELLLLAESDLEGLPGIGARKAKRIESVFRAPFPTTDARLDDVWVNDANSAIQDATVAAAAVPPPTTLPHDVDESHPLDPVQMPVMAAIDPHASAASLAPPSPSAPDHRGGLLRGSTHQTSAAFKQALSDMLHRELDDDDEDA